jgi:CHAD domain-containing protein
MVAERPPNRSGKRVNTVPPSAVEISIALPDAEQVAAELAAPAPARGASVEELVRHDLVASTLRLLRHEAAIRLGRSTDGSPTEAPGWDHEEVHQARVATRRWRSTLRTFGRVLDPEWSLKLTDELSWLAGLLGAVRDLDVLLAGLQRDLEALPGEDAEAGRRLLGRLAGARATEHRRLLAAMGQPRYAGLLSDLIAAAGEPAVLASAAEPAELAVPPLVRGRWQRLRGAVREAGDRPSDEALHQIRIRAKRCRYAAEAAEPVFGEPARAFAKAVAGLQEVLGDQHDAVVAEGWLRRTATSARRDEAFAAGQLVAVARARAAAARERWRVLWILTSRKRLRAWL